MNIKKMKYKRRADQENTDVLRPLEPTLKLLILSHQALEPLHFASKHSMTQPLKEKQLSKGKKSKGEKSS